ncbi:MAG: hypothetical protein HOV79_03430, partial [Hamadaea sp.]|nr:hypothetical protein [Hamadaea sp.]
TVTSATAPVGGALAKDGAAAFARRFAAAFGLTSAHTLAVAGTTTLPDGEVVTRFQQTSGGLPVLGGQVVVTARGAKVQSAVGEASTLTPVTTKATVAAGTATATALARTAADLGIPAADLHAQDADLVLYDPALLGATGAAGLRPTWQVEITLPNGSEVATVLVDATGGDVRLLMSERQTAKSRLICDLASATGVNLNLYSAYACTPTSPLGQAPGARQEGEGATSVADVDLAYDMLGATYDFYRSNFKVDSYDGRGAQIQATVRACHSSCPFENAFWEGNQFVFGPGFVTDDVAAHEYTHAVTEHSAKLLYAYQSGAINEALSDIMGEFFDQATVFPGEVASPWLIGEELPPSTGVLRSMSDPNAYGQPYQVGGASWYRGAGDNGGVHYNSGVANWAAYKIATAIGNAKSAQLWWRVMHVLPSAADYAVLGAALTSSCTRLIGFHGITAANCASVAQAVTDARMTSAWQELGNTGVKKVEKCAAAGQPLTTVYFEGFEQHGAWTRTVASAWYDLPSAEVPYQYALGGKGSLNGWATSTAVNNATVVTPAIAVPAQGGTYLHFSSAMLDPSSNTGIGFAMSVNGTAWQVPNLPTLPAGTSFLTNLPQTKGYSDIRVDLSSLAGKSVKFRFAIHTPALGMDPLDWYLDNFHVYQCAARPAAPTGYAYLAPGQKGVIGGLSTAFVPAGQTLKHFELSYSPSVAGAPATMQPGQVVELSGVTSPQEVRVRAVTSTGATSDWTVLVMSSRPPLNCQTSAFLSFAACYPEKVLARR